jgi:hypothetical protein
MVSASKGLIGDHLSQGERNQVGLVEGYDDKKK